jgi:antirestriction protein ArdC
MCAEAERIAQPEVLTEVPRKTNHTTNQLDHPKGGSSMPPFSISVPNPEQREDNTMPSAYDIITERIITQLESGTAPWHKPWKSSGGNGLPRNLVSGHEYRGINTWILLSSGYGSSYWLTFRQAKELGGHIRKGEKGLPVVFWKFGTREVQDDGDVVQKSSVLCRYYTVFNSDQCEELRVQPVQETTEQPQVSPIESCEQVISGWQTKPVIHEGANSASYSKVMDQIAIPDRTCFDSVEEFYSTLFHELAHSTGHPDRLNRSTLTDFERFGDNDYSREELIAEMGAAFISGYCGIENRTIENSAAYLANWLKVLKGDSRLVLIAASQAQKAADMILGRGCITPQV